MANFGSVREMDAYEALQNEMDVQRQRAQNTPAQDVRIAGADPFPTPVPTPVPTIGINGTQAANKGIQGGALYGLTPSDKIDASLDNSLLPPDENIANVSLPYDVMGPNMGTPTAPFPGPKPAPPNTSTDVVTPKVVTPKIKTAATPEDAAATEKLRDDTTTATTIPFLEELLSGVGVGFPQAKLESLLDIIGASATVVPQAFTAGIGNVSQMLSDLIRRPDPTTGKYPTVDNPQARADFWNNLRGDGVGTALYNLMEDPKNLKETLRQMFLGGGSLVNPIIEKATSGPTATVPRVISTESDPRATNLIKRHIGDDLVVPDAPD